MSDMNRVILLGHLGNAPELKQLSDGLSVLKMRLATNESWLDKTKQERQERVEWHDVTVFGARAEGLARILGKGDCIAIEGALRTSSWEKDGVKRYRTEIIAQNVMLTGKRGGRGVQPLLPGAEAPSDEVPLSVLARTAASAPARVIENDVPF